MTSRSRGSCSMCTLHSTCRKSSLYTAAHFMWNVRGRFRPETGSLGQIMGVGWCLELIRQIWNYDYRRELPSAEQLKSICASPFGLNRPRFTLNNSRSTYSHDNHHNMLSTNYDCVNDLLSEFFGNAIRYANRRQKQCNLAMLKQIFLDGSGQRRLFLPYKHPTNNAKRANSHEDSCE